MFRQTNKPHTYAAARQTKLRPFVTGRQLLRASQLDMATLVATKARSELTVQSPDRLSGENLSLRESKVNSRKVVVFLQLWSYASRSLTIRNTKDHLRVFLALRSFARIEDLWPGWPP